MKQSRSRLTEPRTVGAERTTTDRADSIEHLRLALIFLCSRRFFECSQVPGLRNRQPLVPCEQALDGQQLNRRVVRAPGRIVNAPGRSFLFHGRGGRLEADQCGDDGPEIQAALDAVAENATQGEEETSGGDDGPHKIVVGFANRKKQHQLYDRLKREGLTVKMVTL